MQSPKSVPVSSRLARREQQKVVRQTAFFLVLALGIGIGFVFIILPGFIRLISSLNTTEVGSNNSDSLPPQVPILAAPPVATPSAEVVITGYGEKQSQVVVLLNGTENSRQAINDEGNFTFTLPLEEGDNEFKVYAIDEAQNESSVSKSYVIARDSQAPTLEITEPTANQEIQSRKNQLVTIKGKTEPEARVTVNGRLVFAGLDGTFSTTYSLQEGENKLQFESLDKAGNVTKQELTVTFKP